MTTAGDALAPRLAQPSRPLRAVVVDDELLAREGLSCDLATLGIEVVAACGDARRARDALTALRPDLLFLDIEMPEMDGFALLESFEPEDLPPVIIFVTAYDRHAVRAFEARALDYLLKPVAPTRLRDAVMRAAQRVTEFREARDDADSPADTPTHASTPARYLAQLVVRDRVRQLVIPVEDIEWIQAESYYARLHITRQRPRLLRERMAVLESRLDPALFIRTHRSAIVRLALVRTITSLSRYESVLTLCSGAVVPLSRERRATVEARLAGR